MAMRTETLYPPPNEYTLKNGCPAEAGHPELRKRACVSNMDRTARRTRGDALQTRLSMKSFNQDC